MITIKIQEIEVSISEKTEVNLTQKLPEKIDLEELFAAIKESIDKIKLKPMQSF